MKSGDDQAHAACQVLAGTFHGVLTTHSLEQAGYPFGSVAPYVLDQDGLPLLLLSHLSQHTKNLDADGRCGINLGGDNASLKVEGREQVSMYRPLIEDPRTGERRVAPGERHFCRHCGSALWAWDPRWPDLFHPAASAHRHGPARPYRTQPLDVRLQSEPGPRSGQHSNSIALSSCRW